MPELTPEQSQWMMMAGLVILGWSLTRQYLKGRRRRLEQDVQQVRDMRQLPERAPVSGLPLATAPRETQRWQVEMLDLQRELKAELDTKIAVVQTLLRQADERIALLNSIRPGQDPAPATEKRTDVA